MKFFLTALLASLACAAEDEVTNTNTNIIKNEDLPNAYRSGDWTTGWAKSADGDTFYLATEML